MLHRHTKQANVVGKMAPTDWLEEGLLPTFTLLRKKKKDVICKVQ